jgi:hypothetical protein
MYGNGFVGDFARSRKVPVRLLKMNNLLSPVACWRTLINNKIRNSTLLLRLTGLNTSKLLRPKYLVLFTSGVPPYSRQGKKKIHRTPAHNLAAQPDFCFAHPVVGKPLSHQLDLALPSWFFCCNVTTEHH